MKFSGLTIGVPREILDHEFRVSAIPDTVKNMVSQGARVLVETGAGLEAYIHDEEYIEAGAEIAADVSQVYNQADIILKVKEPLPNEQKGTHEVNLMKSGQVLVTFLHPANPANHQMVRDLAGRGVTSFSLDCIPRISRAQTMDALTSMSTVAGYKGVISAACRIPKFIPMIGTAVGAIQPATVFILGTGVAGLQALATAKRLGAVIYAADVRPDAAEQAMSLGAKIIDTGIPPESAVGEGGYALHLPDELLEAERDAIRDIVSRSDIVVLSALIPRKIAPVLIDEAMVKSMKPGSAIVDIAIDQGGNCELTVKGEVSRIHNVYIDGTQNIPGSVPQSSSWLFAKNIYNFISLIVDNGKIVINMDDEIITSSLVTRDGELVNRDVIDEIKLFQEH